MGGVGAIHPAGTASAILNLPAGEYVILCFIPSPSDQVAHHDKGIIMGLTVQAVDGASAAEPKADLSVRLKDFTFDMPASLSAGPHTIQVVNDGPESHEFNILKLEDGTFAALAGTAQMTVGTYSVKGDIFTEESNNQGCPSPMHYKYTFDGVNLKFQPVEDPAKDPCDGRKGDFNETATWVLKQ